MLISLIPFKFKLAHFSSLIRTVGTDYFASFFYLVALTRIYPIEAKISTKKGVIKIK